MKQMKVNVGQLVLFQLGLIILALLVNSLLIKKNILTVLLNGIEICYQLIIGVSIGLLISGLIVLLLKYSKKKHFNLNHLEVLYNSKYFTIMFLSFITGLSEEFFFRAVIQSYTGLIFGAIIFTFAHSQFWIIPPLNSGKILFGFTILLMGFVFGVLYNMVGFFAAVCAHFIFDFILLIGLKYIRNTNSWDKS